MTQTISEVKEKEINQIKNKHRYKHVASNPLSLTNIGEGSFQSHLTSYVSSKNTKVVDQARVQLRIEKMKQMKLKEMMDTNKTDGTDNWERETALNHITFIRDHQKKDVIETLVKDHKSTEMDLEVRPGEPSFLNILISNSSKRADVYSVKIEDPDENILKSQELTLIDNSNNNEWKYWFEQSKWVEPSAWDMIHDSTIYLNASEQWPMLFKFFTYRETIVSLKKSDHNDPLTLAPRKIYVKVFQQSDESLIKWIWINIIPRPNPIDHVFRFYEPENSYVTVTLPTFTSIPLSTHPDLFIEWSLPWVTSQVIDNNQIQWNFKTPFSPEILSFYVFIYHNSFKDYLLAACHLKVHALTSFFTTVRTGVRKPINIPMFASRKQQSVMVYTDDEVVSEITQRPIALDITQSTNVQLTVKT